MLFGQQAGTGLAEAHRPATATALHLAHHEEEEAEDQQNRDEVDEDRAQRVAGGHIIGHIGAIGGQFLADIHLKTIPFGLELAAIRGFARGAVVFHRDRADCAGF